MKKLLFLIGFIGFVIAVSGQDVQFGLAVSAGNTIFHKGQSEYENRFASSQNIWGFGVEIPVEIKLSDNWGARTGLGYQMKSYQFYLENFSFPGLSGSGGFYIQPNMSSFQLPVLFSYNNYLPNENSIDLVFGPVVGVDVVRSVENGTNWRPQYEGPDSLAFHVDMPSNFKTHFSLNAFVGVAYSVRKEGRMSHQFRVSYEYGMLTSAPQFMQVTLTDGQNTRDYTAFLQPYLSMVKFSFSFYPQLLKDK